MRLIFKQPNLEKILKTKRVTIDIIFLSYFSDIINQSLDRFFLLTLYTTFLSHSYHIMLKWQT